MGVNVLIKIKENLELLSKSERKLAEWILQYPKDVIHMTVTGLAKEADSSPKNYRPVVSLIRISGLSGFKITAIGDTGTSGGRFINRYCAG